MKKIFRGNRTVYIFILFGIIISFFWSIYNLNKFDKIKINYEGKLYNQLLYADLASTWRTAEKFKKELDKGHNFFLSIPNYERFLLPSLIVGYYYHVINKDIYVVLDKKEIVIKEKNFKFNILIFQIFFYFFSVYLFSTELKKKIDGATLNVIIFFLCLEPSLLQWHSSFWSESIFLSLMIIFFYLLLKNSKSFFCNVSIGVLMGIMFMQRAVSFLYILPVLIYFILIFKKNFKPFIILSIGYLLIILTLGYNNYKKTDYFYVLPSGHQYNSYYHYFAHNLFADRENLSSDQAKKIIENEESEWIIKNNINLKSMKDIAKNINYRNEFFLDEILKNPIYFSQLFLKRVISMSIIHPFWVNQHFSFDKTDLEAKNNPKEYYNKNLLKNIFYSIFIYFFTVLGVIKILKEILLKKEINEINKFYVFNIFSILYFILVSGLWGNPKYFAPCMISVCFFFSVGFKYTFSKYKFFSN